MFELYNKDILVATFNIVEMYGIESTDNLNIFEKLPYGCSSERFDEWVKGRYAAKHRSHLAGYLNLMGANNITGFIKLTHSISINDTFWIKEDSEKLKWQDVSPYSNDFDEMVQHLAFDGVGLRGMALSSTSPEFGTNGAYEKCWKREKDGIYLYKRGTEGFSNAGLEPYCEGLASQVFVAMKAGIPYDIVHYRNKIASKCKLFTDEHTGFVPYAALPEAGSTLVKVIKYYQSIGELDNVRRMLICDALTFNTDRHEGNFGCLYDTDTMEIMGMAPCFDYNLSLFPMEIDDAFADVNSFIDKYEHKLGGNFVAVASGALTSSIRSDLINLKGFEYEYEGDDKFKRSRVHWLSVLTNEQIHRILNSIDVFVYSSPNKDSVSNVYRFRMDNGWDEDAFQRRVPNMMRQLGIRHMSELENNIMYLDNEWFKTYSSLFRNSNGSYAHHKLTFIFYMKWILSMQGITPSFTDINLLAMVYAERSGKYVKMFEGVDLDAWEGDNAEVFTDAMKFDYIADVDVSLSRSALALIPNNGGDIEKEK